MSHDAHGDHPPYLQHHFDTPQQQFSAGKLGMWLFLAQEILFFGGLFCFYAVYRYNHPEVFDYAHHFLDWRLGALNTVVLLVSSLTMALAVRAAQVSNTRQLLVMLAITFVCAGGFMVVKYFEYAHKIHAGLVWGSHFDYEKMSAREKEQQRTPELVDVKSSVAALDNEVVPTESELPRTQLYTSTVASTGLSAEYGKSEGVHLHDSAVDPGHPIHLPDGVRPQNIHVFFSIYFCLTGLHGIHVLAGMIMLVWLFWGGMKGRYNKDYFTPVDLGGLYWHLVDLVWIYLFPLLYLIS